MKLKRALQLAEELATWGFNEGTGDFDEGEDDDYREAMDTLWDFVSEAVKYAPHRLSPEESGEALDWLTLKNRWYKKE